MVLKVLNIFKESEPSEEKLIFQTYKVYIVIGLLPLYGSVHFNEQLFPSMVGFDIEGESGGPKGEQETKKIQNSICIRYLCKVF